MSIFSKIKDAIFGTARASVPAERPASSAAARSAGQPTQSSPAPQAKPAAAATAVDIEAVLTQLQAKNPQKLNWRTSIVDLMKLVGLDSSLDNRKELARELGYSGDTSDSAAMNIWLHKRVMKELAANGGKVPQELTD